MGVNLCQPAQPEFTQVFSRLTHRFRRDGESTRFQARIRERQSRNYILAHFWSANAIQVAYLLDPVAFLLECGNHFIPNHGRDRNHADGLR
jgi:hypothetical protein